MSHTITFEPPATETQWNAIRAMFGVCQPRWVIDTDNHDEHETRVVASVTTNSWPCDVTVYPGSPKTWARAVYEAGVEHGIARAAIIKRAADEYRKAAGGVTQQPAGKPIRMCHGTLESSPADDDPGWVYAYSSNPLPVCFVINGVEYRRPVTPPATPPRCH